MGERHLTPAEQRLGEIQHEAGELLEHLRMVLGNAQEWAQANADPDTSFKLEVSIGSLQMARGSIENAVTALGEVVELLGAKPA